MARCDSLQPATIDTCRTCGGSSCQQEQAYAQSRSKLPLSPANAHSHVLDGTVWHSDIMCLGAQHRPVFQKHQILLAPAAQHGEGGFQAAKLLGTDCKQQQVLLAL